MGCSGKFAFFKNCLLIGLLYIATEAPISIYAKPTILLNGAGASFPSDIYKSWIGTFKSHRIRFVSLSMRYEAIGSGGGKKRIKGLIQPEVQYAGSDTLLPSEDYIQYPDLQMFPTMGGAVGLGFNIPGLTNLNLSRDHIVGIYNGTISWWNESSLQDLNPDATLPQERIIVISRSDKSGTTEIFTSALNAFSMEWKQTYGVFSQGLDDDGNPIKWNPDAITIYGKTTLGVSGLILSFKYSIGYLSEADAAEFKIPVAALLNRAGNLVNPDAANVQSSMDDYASSFSNYLTTSISDGSGDLSYPIAGYTYFIVYKTGLSSCDQAIELYRYVEWFLMSDVAKRICEQKNMVPLSKQVANLVMDRVMKNITCSGINVFSLVAKQKEREARILQTWRLPVYIGVPIASLVLIVIIILMIWQEIRINKAVYFNEWLIPGKSLKFVSRKGVGAIRNSRSLFSLAKSIHSIKSLVSGGDSSIVQGLSSLDANICIWQEKNVLLNETEFQNVSQITKNTKKNLIWMRDFVKHNHVLQFYGLTDVDGKLSTVVELPEKGILKDILQDEKYNLDQNFQFSIACDVALGMSFLHGLDIVHGKLSTSTCSIDSRWNVKITDWENCLLLKDLNSRIPYNKIKPDTPKESVDANITARKQMWLAPEFMEDITKSTNKKADIYSFAMVLQEIFTREDPFSELNETMEAVEIVRTIKERELRPVQVSNVPESFLKLQKMAWSANPSDRPDFVKIAKSLRDTKPNKKEVIDCMMEAVEEYAEDLEERVSARSAELAIAMANVKNLLDQMLPPSVAEALYQGKTVEPETFESVTICFSDIVGFNSISMLSTPEEVVNMLNDLYKIFDDIVDKHDVYKVETIGDVYMVISGLPQRNGKAHAGHIATMALDLAIASGTYKIPHMSGASLQLRVGMHSGSVVAAVIGMKMPRYCLFGDTVNTSSRMQSTSAPMKIQMSSVTNNILQELGDFITKERGEVTVKGKGTMTTYWLHGKAGYENKIPKELTCDVPVVQPSPGIQPEKPSK